MKTLTEILVRYREPSGPFDDLMDFNTDDLLQFMPYEIASEFLKDTAASEDWDNFYRPLSKENVITQMREYMPFAWEKCTGERGISSTRSIAHYHAWLWILEDKEALEFLLDEDNYPCFGAPILKYICDKYSFDYNTFLEPYNKETADSFIKGEGCD